MRTREGYVVELAQTVNEMFTSGDIAPSAEDIAEAHFPNKALAGEIIESVRKRLAKIRNILEEDYELPVCLLSATYYTRFRDNPPQTDADARRCIPMGHGKSTAGIRLQQGDDDLIWEAMVRQNLAAGAGKLKKSTDRTLDAVTEGRLSQQHGGALITQAQRRAAPDQPGLAEKITEALPEGDDDAAEK
ncbi:MAG: hypothetical protein AABM29_07020 [Actinomycetota bacterium]